MSAFTLAIVGRPNVGKSTLFNKLVGRRLALVDDQPGVTRDLRWGDGRLGPLRFDVVDTAGLEDAKDQSLQGRMRALTERAIAEADIILFLVDARADLTPVDYEVADLLRRQNKPVLIGANKAEGRAGEGGVIDAYALGLGDPLAISAEHGEGFEDLLRALNALSKTLERPDEAETDIDVDDVDDELKPLRVAVVGRPNAGKSTLINSIVGDERLLTGPEAGITRDSIAVDLDWDGRAVKMFDTAGMRKRAKVQDKLEKLSVADGLRAVRFAEVVVVLLDAGISFETQDLRIADLAEREGRAVVIALNKWDEVEDKNEALAEAKEKLGRLLPQLRGVPLVTLSALTGKGLPRLRKAILEIYELWNIRIPTGPLNTWLKDMVSHHPPPAPGGRRIKLKYMTQTKTRPPGFVAMCSIPEGLPEAYKRYLVNGLREDFDLPGVPIRLTMRRQDNPFANKKERRITKLRKGGKPRE